MPIKASVVNASISEIMQTLDKPLLNPIKPKTEEELAAMMEEHKKQADSDVEDIRNSLVIEPTGYPMEIYVIAYSKNGRKNHPQKIKCKTNKPMGSWCYDLESDSFVVSCVSWCYLGKLPRGYKLKMNDVEGWERNVPMSKDFVLSNLTPAAKEELEKFKKSHPKKGHVIKYIQCSGVFNG